MTFLFWLFFFSISFLSVLTSVFFKNGITIQVILIPLLIMTIYFVLQSKEDKPTYFLLEKKDIFRLIIGSILIWLLNAVFVIDFTTFFQTDNHFNFLIPSKDAFFYGRLSEKLLTSSYESVFALHQNLKTIEGTTPYHYFEFWISAFFCKIFSVSGYVAYSLFTIPLLQICAWIGILAIYEQIHHKKNTSRHFLWAFVLLFLGGIYLPIYSIIKGFEGTYWQANTIFTGLSEHYFFWIAIFLAFQTKKYKVCLWIVFILPIISPTLWAASWTGLFFVGSALFYQKKSAFLKEYSVEIIAFFLIPLCYFLFYFLTYSSQNLASSEVTFLALSKSNKTIVDVFKEIIIYLFGFLVIYIPFIILFYFEFKNQLKKNFRKYLEVKIYLFFLIGGILGGIAFYFIFPLHTERFQFLRNFILPFLQVSCIYLLAIKQNHLNNKVKAIFVILLVYGFGFTLHWFLKETQPHQIYSQVYLNVIKKELIQKKELKRGAIFHSASFYKDKVLFNRNENFEIEGRYLAFKNDLEQFYNLDMPCINYQEKNAFLFSETDFFAVWLKNKIHNEAIDEKYICTDSLKWLFVEEQQLDFVIIGKNVSIPLKIQSKIKVQLQDSKSGEIFLRIK